MLLTVSCAIAVPIIPDVGSSTNILLIDSLRLR